MKIRSAHFGDLKPLTELFDGYRQFYRTSSDLEAAASFLSERFRNRDSEIYVAENEENELIGFVQLYPLFSSTRMKRMWLLNDLYVDPKARGQHLSVKLIERAKQLVRDSKACGMYLETEKSNDIGNNLYPKTGFELYDSVNFYEWENEE